MLNLKTRAFIFSLTLLILLVLAGLTNVANAESVKQVRKKTITVIETESEGADQEETEPTGTAEREGVITAKFGGSSGQSGLSGCKTETLSKSLIQDLKADCQAWVKDQKAELKKRYLTSSCEASCEDCGMGLKRCFVTGTVKYLLK